MEEVNLITQRSNQNPTTKFNVVEEDPSSFFDGENKTISLFDEENMSNANGKKRQSRNHWRTFEKVMSYTPLGLIKQGLENRAKRAPMIDAAKLEQAKSSTAMAKAQEAQVAGDIAMAKALEKSAPKSKSEKSKTMLYVGIGLGVLVIGGIITYFIVKGKGGKKGK